MDMSGFGLAIVAVVVFVAWCVLASDLNEASKLPREIDDPMKNWHPTWKEWKKNGRMEDYDGM